MIKSAELILVIVKNGSIVFGSKNDIINITLKNNCAISKIIKKLNAKTDLNKHINKFIKLSFKKQDTKNDEKIDKINNNTINKVVRSGEFLFFGHETKKITYIKEIIDSEIILNDVTPFNEDDFTVYIKLKKLIKVDE